MSSITQDSSDDEYVQQGEFRARMDDVIFHPTRFASGVTMDQLGLREGVEEIFSMMGLQYMLRARAGVYPEACKEFFSTLKFEAPTLQTQGLIVFTIGEVIYTLTVREICEALRVPYEHYEDVPHVRGSTNVWENIASGNYNSGNAKISQVRNPSIRYGLQVLGSTLFAREQPDVPTEKELMLLYGATRTSMKTVRDQPLILEFKKNPISLFMDYLIRVRHHHEYGEVVDNYIGGMVTPLLRRARVDLGGFEYDNTRHFLDIESLVGSWSIVPSQDDPRFYNHLYLEDDNVVMSLPLPCHPSYSHARNFQALSFYPPPRNAYRAPPPYDVADVFP